MPHPPLSERPYRSLWPFCRMVAGAAESSSLLELDGVIACMAPVSPERSITSSVAYDRLDALERGLDQIGAAFADAGVRAWTVWVPPRDQAAQRMLEEAGHRLDASPTAMALELSRFERRPNPDLVVDTEPDAVEVGRINDAAYGMAGDFERAFTQRPGELHLYAARVDGEAVACVGSVHDEVDCGIYLVATHPDARGRGLAHDLVTAALNEARDAGCETASLQSTEMGKPIYTRLGFTDFGPLQMWERRTT